MPALNNFRDISNNQILQENSINGSKRKNQSIFGQGKTQITRNDLNMIAF